VKLRESFSYIPQKMFSQGMLYMAMLSVHMQYELIEE